MSATGRDFILVRAESRTDAPDVARRQWADLYGLVMGKVLKVEFVAAATPSALPLWRVTAEVEMGR